MLTLAVWRTQPGLFLTVLVVMWQLCARWVHTSSGCLSTMRGWFLPSLFAPTTTKHRSCVWRQSSSSVAFSYCWLCRNFDHKTQIGQIWGVFSWNNINLLSCGMYMAHSLTTCREFGQYPCSFKRKLNQIGKIITKFALVFCSLWKVGSCLLQTKWKDTKNISLTSCHFVLLLISLKFLTSRC